MFNERLKNLRLVSNFSQKELALKINLSPNIICEYEKGRSQPTIETLIKLSGIFNCSIDYLVGNEDEFGVIAGNSNLALTSNESEMLSHFKLLSADLQREAIGFVKALAL